MALSPSIPTSFVPKQPVSPGAKRGSSGSGILLLISILILFIAVVCTVGVFLYDGYLTSVEKAKAAQLVLAQQNVNLTTVQDFIRLRNRLVAAKGILDNHTELSRFFTLLGTITEQNVSFNSLSVQVANDHSATIELQGTAKSFNSLAVEASTFASQPDIKSAIFSGISSQKNLITFTVDATLAPELVVAPPAAGTQSSSVPTVTAPVSAATTTANAPVAPVTTVQKTTATSTATASTTKP